MTAELAAWAILGGAGLAGLVVVAVALLKGWRDWIGLQRLALEARVGEARAGAGPQAPAPAARIELADLRERVRKLEAIAAGVDP